MVSQNKTFFFILIIKYTVALVRAIVFPKTATNQIMCFFGEFQMVVLWKYAQVQFAIFEKNNFFCLHLNS